MMGSLLFFIWWLCLLWESCAGLSDEGIALMRFRERVELDPYGALSGWGGDGGGGENPCEWVGVGCSDGRVVDLNLSNLRLKGTLAPELGKLIQLTSLNARKGTMRKLLRRGGKAVAPSPSPSPAPAPAPAPVPSPSPKHINRHSLANEHHKNRHSLAKEHHKNRHLSPSPVMAPSPVNEQPASSLQKHPDSNASSSSASPTSNSGKSDSSSLAIYMPIAGGFSFLLAISAIYFLCFRTNKVGTVRPWSTGLSGQLQKAFVADGVPALRRSELEAACEDFSNVIGTFSDWKVYKGTLSNGVEIAVASSMITSAKDWSKDSESQLRNKISTLSRVNHKNFMNLLGYCEEEEPFTRIMVFEYAPNGTLFEHLHIKEAEHLDWAARLRIAMGIAYCLEHMLQIEPPIVPRNLNSSSIYLTEDYAAKVSECVFLNQTKEANSAQDNSSDLTNIVYKFGILLLEILSGRRPFSEDDDILVCWASFYFTGKRPLKDMLDTTLTSFRENDLGAFSEVLRSCTNPDPSKRPTMSEVTKSLRAITSISPDAASPRLSPLWWAELEILAT
ncbi:Non-specific serine/threonine protein kinase protein [Dioscorea alata]|uniref:Non-specific serine/threonine protein kinase protein n=1 Tax=Dioscorea alata TaxID=55571 RepID=A0ACB7VTS8_DIOAL|nr:Non-specific serine/threonine protein kinase protein [Dioscorea alata]